MTNSGQSTMPQPVQDRGKIFKDVEARAAIARAKKIFTFFHIFPFFVAGLCLDYVQRLC